MKQGKHVKLKPVTFLLSAVTLGCALSFSASANVEAAETGIEIESTITDEAFRDYVKAQFDTDKDGSLSPEEIKKAKVIDFDWNESVEDLTGLNIFTSLERLACAGTSVSTLDLSGNTALKELDCTYLYDLTELDVTQNVKLEKLECFETGLTKLDVSKNVNLKELHCYQNAISSLDVSKNANLIRLDCNNTPITELNVRSNPKLFALNCEDTKVNKLDISKNPALYEVYITNTPISTMDYSKNKELVHIRVSGTNMTKLDVTHNPKLAALYCYNTHIKELNLQKNPEMFEIFCYNSDLQKIDVSKFKGLRTLDCHNTKISSLNVKNNPNLVGLYCSDTKVTKLDVSKNPELQRLEFANTAIANVNLSSNKKLRILNCNNATMNNLDLSKFGNLQEVYCINAKVKTLKLPANKAFLGVDCSKNQLTELDLSRLPGPSDMYLGAIVSPQSRSVYFKVSGGSMKFDMKTIVSNISKVSLVKQDGCSYNSKTGILTVNDPDTKEVTYEYKHGYTSSKVDPMKVTLKIRKEYMITEGNHQIVEEGKDLSFRSEADLSTFQKVLVDGKEISPEHYTVTEGSTIVTLKKEYLETLSEGTHKISIVSADGAAQASFTVPAKKPDTDKKKDSGDENISLDKNKRSPVGTGHTPGTADHSQPLLWSSLLTAALFGLVLNMRLRRSK